MGGFLKKNKSSQGKKAKKSKDYFLELDDTGAVKTESTANKPEPVQSTKTTEPEAKKPAPKAVEAKPPKTAPQEKPVTASISKPQPIPGLTFAPNYLLPVTTNTGRRRPGLSMSSFLAMASQMQPPRS